jgi:hypothetical protein
MYISAAQSFIKSIAVGRDPPENAKSVTDYTRDPVYIVCGSHDATVTVVDLRDREQHYEIARTRSEPSFRFCFSPAQADCQCRIWLSGGLISWAVLYGRIPIILPNYMIPEGVFTLDRTISHITVGLFG